jgi:hypothetical protein
MTFGEQNIFYPSACNFIRVFEREIFYQREIFINIFQQLGCKLLEEV